MQLPTLFRAYVLSRGQLRSQLFKIAANTRIIGECRTLMRECIDKIKQDNSNPYRSILAQGFDCLWETILNCCRNPTSCELHAGRLGNRRLGEINRWLAGD